MSYFLARMFKVVLFFAMLIGFVAFSVRYYANHYIKFEKSEAILIQKGDNFSKVVHNLVQDGFLNEEAASFVDLYGKIWFKVMSSYHKFGEYYVSKDYSLEDFLKLITSNKTINRSITIPEGLTKEQIIQVISSKEDITGDLRDIKIEEGYLMPETYFYNKGYTKKQIIEKMQKDMDLFLEKAWNERDQSVNLKTKEEALILASIVEKEAVNEEEKSRIAAVYLNRLSKKMRLQSDPTVIYGITKGKTSTLDRAVVLKDLEQKNDYNTYRKSGLPIGPICSPGKASIVATLHPEKNDYLFFVADGNGGHKFSSNFDDHVKEKISYKKAKREKERKSKK